jgi:catechol 2,3-dioxygenase-like lactoylglutathione lyase family enzyme
VKSGRGSVLPGHTVFNRAHLLRALFALALLSFRAVSESSPKQPLLEQGRGVDHVVVAVHDLAQARRDFERLGFQVSEGGHFPGGVYNNIIFFPNQSYLELLSIKSAEKNSNVPVEDFGITKFLDKHEGAMFLGLNVSSAKDSADYLRKQNFDVSGPDPGSLMERDQNTPPPPEWYTFGTEDNPKPPMQTITLPVFFIEYVKKDRWDKARVASTVHMNTALSIHAVWFAVHDTDAQLRTLRKAGFLVAKSSGPKLFGIPGQELTAGLGTMVLLAPKHKDKTDTVGKYLADFGEGVIAISIEVADIEKAKEFAESYGGSKLNLYKGAYGQSFLLSPDKTHGIWVEMFQR